MASLSQIIKFLSKYELAYTFQINMFPYLGYIIATLHIQVLKSDGVLTKQLISINWNKIDAKEATKIVCSRSGCNSAQVLSWIQNSKLVPENRMKVAI